MRSKKAVIEQVILCPICILLGYISASLFQYNGVSYEDTFTILPHILILMIFLAALDYTIFSLILRTRARGYFREIFRIFEPLDKPDYLGAICGAIVFFAMYMLVLQLPIDYPIHINEAFEFDWRYLSESLEKLSYPVWHCSVNIVARVFYIPPLYAAALVSAGFYTAEFSIIRKIIIHYNRDIAEKKLKLLDICALSIMFVQPVYIPWFNPRQVIGQGTPNVWHNPTIACCYPFALICTFLFINMVKAFWEDKKIGVVDYVRFGLFLLISVAAKPSFFQIFIPAVAILFIIMLIQSKGKSFFFSLKFVLSCVPAGLWCIVIFMRSFVSEDTNRGNGIGIGFLEVWSTSSPNVAVSFIIAIMFPLAYFIVYNKKALNKDIFIILLCFMCGLFEWTFLKETGDRMYDGNFGWGFQNAISLLFVICGTQYFGGLLREKATSKKSLVPICVYTLNVLFGMRYYFELLSGNINM